MVFKMTEDQRKEVAKIVGEENANLVFDEEQQSELAESKESLLTRVGELQQTVDGIKGKVVVPKEEYDDLKKAKEAKKPDEKDPASTAELDELRENLTKEFTQKFDEINSEREFYKGKTVEVMAKNAIIASASKKPNLFADPNDAVVNLGGLVRVEPVEENGKRDLQVVVRKPDGSRKLNSQGHPMSVDEAVAELAKQKPYLLDGYKSVVGSGSGGGQGGDTSPQDRLAALDIQYKEALKNGDIALSMRIENQRTPLRLAKLGKKAG